MEAISKDFIDLAELASFLGRKVEQEEQNPYTVSHGGLRRDAFAFQLQAAF